MKRVMMTRELMAKLKRSLIEAGFDSYIDDDINYYYNKLSEFSWFGELSLDRQIALVELAFIGWKNFLSFQKMFKALDRTHYKKASFEILNAKWLSKMKDRAVVLSKAMATGIYDI
jgi:hypothetical protein